MIIIGELINSTRREIADVLEKRDAAYIQGLAKKQVQSGATLIDINAGTLLEKEVELIEWLVKIIQEAVDVPLCIDSPNPEAIEAGLRLHREKRWSTLLPVRHRGLKISLHWSASMAHQSWLYV